MHALIALRLLPFLLPLLTPTMAPAQASRGVTKSGPEAAAAAATPTPPALENTGNSRWVLLPNIHLEDVLYPLPVEGNGVPKATLIGTNNAALKSGYNILISMVRLDNPEPRAANIRPVDYVRCYEYFSNNFSQDGTRCFVLQSASR